MVVARTKAQKAEGLTLTQARDVNAGKSAAPVAKTTPAASSDSVDANYQLQPGENLSAYQTRVDQYNRSKAENPTGVSGDTGQNPSGVMTAQITTPANLQKKGPAPAVVTSDAAERDLADKKLQADQLQMDTTQHRAIVNQPPPVPVESGKTKEDTSSEPKQPQSLDEQLTSILGDLNTNQVQIQQDAGDVVSPLAAEQAQFQAEFNKSAIAAINKLNKIASGTYPLSATEKSLLSSTEASYQATIAAQQTANQAYTGQMTELMASLGIATSAPTQAIGMIHAAISTGEQKVADLNAKMATKLAELTQGFQEQDYKMVNDAWKATSDFMKDRITMLKDMQKAVLDAAHQQQQDLKDYAQLTLTTMMNSANFTYREKQDAIENSFRQMSINETQRHNLISELKDTGGGEGAFSTAQKNQLSQAGLANSDVRTREIYVNTPDKFRMEFARNGFGNDQVTPEQLLNSLEEWEAEQNEDGDINSLINTLEEE